jgi:hypothetical protein
MCCIAVRQTVRINIVTPTAIHNRQEKGSRNMQISFSDYDKLPEIRKKQLNGEQLINKLSYVFHLMSEINALRISNNYTTF